MATASDDEDDFEKLSMKSEKTYSTTDFYHLVHSNMDSARKNAIHVTNLPADIKEYELFEKFRIFGKLAEPGIELNNTGKRPFCYIYYNDTAAVDAILSQNPVIIIKGCKLTIKSANSSKMPYVKASSDNKLLETAKLNLDEFCQKENSIPVDLEGSSSNDVCSIWVGNVPLGIPNDKLAAKFTAFGKLANPPVNQYNSRNRSCCYAFINFKSAASVEKALKVNPKIILNGSLLELRRSTSKHDVLPQKASKVDDTIDEISAETESNKSSNSSECRSIYVGNLPTNVNSRELYPIFAHFGKLNVPGITVFNSKHSNSCYAFVNFISKESAEKVLARSQKQPFVFQGNCLSIKQSTSEHNPDVIIDSSSTSSSSDIPPNLPYYMLTASNLPKDILRLEVFNIFRDYGKIAEPPGLQINESECLAKVPFVYLADAEKLMRRSNGRLQIRHNTVILLLKRAYDSAPISSARQQQSNNQPSVVPKQGSKAKPPVTPRPSLELKAKTVQQQNLIDTNKQQSVFKWTEQTVGPAENAIQKPAVQIRNICHLSSDNLLRQYMENPRRSNGGKIVEFSFEKEYDRAVVVFETMNILDNVLNKMDNILDEHHLYVSKLPPFCYSRLYLENIPTWVTLDRLKDFLESRSHCTIRQLQFREDDKGAVVDFEEDQNVERLRRECEQRPLKEGANEMNLNQMKIVPVVYPDAVLVYGKIPSKDSVMLAFEDLLMKEAPEFQSAVRFVVWKPEKNMCLVIFEDCEAVSCLTGNSITIGNEKFKFAPFYDYLGWVPQTGKANFLREHSSTMVHKTLTPLQMKFLQSSGGKRYVKDQVEKPNVYFVYKIDEVKNSLAVTAGNQALSDHYANAILSCMKTVELELDAAMLKTWNEKSSTFLASLDESNVKNWFCHSLNKSTLTILAASSEIGVIKVKVTDFFDTSSKYEECLIDKSLFGRYLKKYHETDFKLKCNQNDMSISFLQDGCLTVCGTKNQIELIKTDVHIIMSDIEEAEYCVNRPGMSNYLRSERGLADISSIAERTRTIIVPEDELESSDIPSAARACGLFTPNGTKLEGMLNGSIKIKVIHGDMTVQKVDAIVNAANENLEHIGGLADSIVKRGGNEIQKECTEHVRKNGKVPVGQVFVSLPGKLPCKNIIHVVGPRYNQGKSGEDKLLAMAIKNILYSANNRQFQSVAIPAVSTQIYGYPPREAIPIIVGAIENASSWLVRVNEIRLVDTNLLAVDLFVNYVKKLPTFVDQTRVVSSSSSAFNSSALTLSRVKPAPIRAVAPPKIITPLPTALPSYNGCAIELIRADIVNVAKRCHVIVNTTSASNLLGGSASCQAIRKAAGAAYTNYIAQHFPNGLQGKTVAVTDAGQLGCQHVFHISCGTWDPVNGPKNIEAKVVDCLNELKSKGLKSIAFPAMGTGGLKYPANLVARAMFDAAVNWLICQRNSVINSIVFVVYPSDTVTIQHFESEYKTRFGISPTVSTSQPAPPTSAVEYNGVLIGPVTVEIVEGDITQEKTDGVMCPTNRELDLSQGQVAKALSKAGGPEFQMIVENFKKDFKKGVLHVFCPTGILPCKCVLFIDAPSNTSEWDNLFERALKTADRLNLKSVAVPALGTGMLNQNGSEVADKMIQTIQDFVSRSLTKRNLNLIRIVIYQSTIYHMFCQRLTTIIARGETKASANSSALSKVYRCIAEKLDLDYASYKNVLVQAHEVEESLRLLICGSAHSVKDAQRKLDNLCDDKCPERTINKEIIGQLDRQVIELLESKAEMFGVRMDVAQNQNKIKIKGFHAVEFQQYVSDYIERLKEETADVNVKWYKRSDVNSTWQPVESGLVRLEKAFQNATIKRYVNMEFENEGEVIVDFEKMQILSKKKALVAKNDCVLFYLKRKDMSDLIPLEWNWDGKSTEDYTLVQLDPRSAEYKNIANDVMRTAPINILKIERVENPVKYKQYLILKEKMEKTLSFMGGHVSERKLYHGTDPVNIPGICRFGFNRSLAGQNGTAYGHGSYFARDCKYSCGYGKTTIFYASVLTGTMALGSPTLKVAPDLDAAKGIKYDSVVDNVANPSIFVVFSDNHAYPYYLITYA